jgi:hypothetical protein
MICFVCCLRYQPSCAKSVEKTSCGNRKSWLNNSWVNQQL